MSGSNNSHCPILSKFTTGNAGVDGRSTGHWLLNDFEAWQQRGELPADLALVGLRSTTRLEIKWGVHRGAEERPGDWAPRSQKTAISILVEGYFTVRFRDQQDPATNIICELREPGDYVIWSEDLEHKWRAEEDSVVLTVRWW